MRVRAAMQRVARETGHVWAVRLFTLCLSGLAILRLWSFLNSGFGIVARCLTIAFVALAAVRPALALLAVSGLAPIVGWFGALFYSPSGSSQTLVLAFLGGWLAHEAAPAPSGNLSGSTLIRPAVLFAGVVLASCAVSLAVLQTSTGDPWFVLRLMAASVAPNSFPEPRLPRSLGGAALLVEGSALYIATVTLSRRDPLIGLRAARIAVLCSAALAALNINRLVEVAARGKWPLIELARSSATVRISSAFPDVNAAGSYFAMMLMLSAGLMFDRIPRGIGWGLAGILSLGALWLTRSRAALGAVPVAAIITYAAGVWTRRRSLIRVMLVGAAALGLSALAADYISRTGVRPVSWSANMRMELARGSLKMFAAHPLFGIGAGRYYDESLDYSSPDLPSNLSRENAHNNFLQILAELGITGFAAFAWLLLAAGRHVWRAYKQGALSPPAVGAASGLVAFLVTCLVGHPLLIPEVAFAFWLVLGVMVSLVSGPVPSTAPVPGRRRWSWRTVVTGGVALLLAVSVPLRARQAIAEAGGVTVGLSNWQTDEQGTPFRWMTARAEFQVLVSARVVTLPLRLDPEAPVESCAVEIYVNGQFLSRFDLSRGAWREFRIVTPPAPPDVHFRRIELRVAGATSPLRIQVGRPVLIRPPA